MPIDLALADADQMSFRPGDVVRLTAAWRLDPAPQQIDIRLVFRTAGKGTTDLVGVAVETRASPLANDQWDLTLTLPADAPPSYDGRLLSITWFAQADVISAKNRVLETAELPLVVSPTGRPIVPQRLAEAKRGKS